VFVTWQVAWVLKARALTAYRQAGPIRTLAASGIKNFRKMLAANEAQTPLRRNVTIDEVGNAGAFLCSDLASGISGEIMYVDGGFHTTAMGSLEE